MPPRSIRRHSVSHAPDRLTGNVVIKLPRRPGELGFALVLTVLGALSLWQAYDISGFEKLSAPGVFPMLASGVMLVSALAIVREVQARPTSRAPLSVDILPRRLLLMIMLLLAYVLLMPRLGFLAGSGLFLFASLSWLWHRPWWAALGVTLISLLAVHLLFRQLFQVILPQGPFDRWLAGVL